MVLGAGGGALASMVLPLRVGVGRLGKGDNVLSWVHLDDVVGMYLWAMDNEDVRGPVNCTAPNPATAAELASSIGSVLGRPVIPLPAAAVRALLGEMGDAVLGSLDVYPRLAVDRGYEFYFTKLVPALEDALMGDERVTLAS
jgi:hypothetical protein